MKDWLKKGEAFCSLPFLHSRCERITTYYIYLMNAITTPGGSGFVLNIIVCEVRVYGAAPIPLMIMPITLKSREVLDIYM